MHASDRAFSSMSQNSQSTSLYDLTKINENMTLLVEKE
jgi:hypothetical protein